MKRFTLSTVLAVLVLVLITASIAWALASGPPSDDTYVDTGTSDFGKAHDTLDLRVRGTLVGSDCGAARTAYLKWNLADLGHNPEVPNKLVQTAVLKLTTTALTSNAAGYRLTLYRVADDTWTEETLMCGDILCQSAPVVGAAIQQTDPLPNPVPAGYLVSFNSQNLVDYINEESAAVPGGTDDNVVSFALRFSTCAASSTQGFEDKESATGKPSLDLANPNAVTLSTFRAANPAVNWPLIAAALLLVAALAGFGIYRRRFSQVRAR